MNIRSVGDVLPLRWVKTRCLCRRLGNWFWLLIVVQLALMALFLVIYNVIIVDM